MSDTPNQRLCKECKEWIDARAPSCYLCGAEGPDVNAALKRAVETERLNSALSRQVANANAEGRAAQQFQAARRTGGAAGDQIASRPLTGINGYDSLVGSIKSSLQEQGFGT